MFSHTPSMTIDQLIQQSMFGLIKDKTGIRAPVQIKHLEYLLTFKKVKGVIKISSIHVKRKILPHFQRVTETEIKFSGATKEEFLEYLNKRGARRLMGSEKILAKL